jgi:hypothetical protein
VKNKFFLFSALLAFSVFFESLAFTYMQQQGRMFYYSNSIIYLFTGLAISILPLFFIQKATASTGTVRGFSRYLPYLAFLFFIFLLAYHISILSPLYKNWTIDIQNADMIPCIQLACRRFLHGQTVYGLVSEIYPYESGATLIYLPMVWMPFLPSVIFGFDPRWTTLSAVFIGLFVSLTPLLKRRVQIPFIPLVLACVSLFLLLNYFLMKEIGFWAMTQEGVVAGLYMLLGFALLRRNYFFIGIMITMCLLSRYVLVLWIPPYLFYVFMSEPRKLFWQLFFSLGFSLLALFILPFFMLDPFYFFGIPVKQSNILHGFWDITHIQEKKYYTVGFYKFFTIDQIWLMTTLEIISSFAVPAIFLAGVFWLKRKYSINERYIAYGSLKICLIFFYGFLAAPYVYVIFPGAIISYVVLFDFLSHGNLAIATNAGSGTPQGTRLGP